VKDNLEWAYRQPDRVIYLDFWGLNERISANFPSI